jgi:hypothetical protein
VEAAVKGETEVIQLLIDYGFHFNFNPGSDETLLGVVIVVLRLYATSIRSYSVFWGFMDLLNVGRSVAIKLG